MLPRYIYQILARFKLRYLLLLSSFISLLLVSTVLANQNQYLNPVIELSQINTPDYQWMVVTPTPVVLPSQTFVDKLNLTQTGNSTIKNIVTVLEYGVNQNIPDNDPAGMTFAFNVTNDTALNEIELLFDITHANPGQLQISLTSPLSTTVVLSGTQQMQNARLPNGLFHFVILNYQNEIPQGVWYLTVSDIQSSTTGIFNAWQISLQTNPHIVYLPIVFKTVSTYSFTPSGLMMLPFIRFEDRPAVAAQSYQVAPTSTPEKIKTPGYNEKAVPATPITRRPTLEVPGTGTPKPTLTPTPTISPTPHVDPSGGFEGEEKLVWRTYSFKGHDLFFTPSSVPVALPVVAYEGEWAAWLGGDDTELSWIETDLIVPFGKPYLFHYAYIQSYDSFCADDLFSGVTQSEALYYANGTTRTDLITSLHSDVIGLIVSGTTDIAAYSPIDLCAANGGGWYLYIYDLTIFEEQKVTIRFKTISDSQATSSMIIDNVGFRGDFPINIPPVPKPFPRVRQNEGISPIATKQPTPALPVLIRKSR